MNITTKKQSYDLWQSGAFGNKLRAWRSVEAWRASGFRGKVALRALLAGGGPCRYNLVPDEVERFIVYWFAEGLSRDNIMINEMAPPNEILQGEFFNGCLSLWSEYLAGCPLWNGSPLPGYFFYSRARLPMREALKAAGEHTYGLRADLMLRGGMTPSSYEDWRVLLDQYPDHVLEVSIYDHLLGDTPGRNALVWEVRRY